MYGIKGIDKLKKEDGIPEWDDENDQHDPESRVLIPPPFLIDPAEEAIFEADDPVVLERIAGRGDIPSDTDVVIDHYVEEKEEDPDLLTEEELQRRIANAEAAGLIPGATPKWGGRAVETVDITEVSDEAGVRRQEEFRGELEDEALLADVFGEVPPEDKIRFEDGDIGLERMADAVHQVWAMWMEHLFKQGWVLTDKGFKIDSKMVWRWRKQMITPYAELSEDEKQSDRDIARRYLNIAWAPEKEE